MTDITVAQAAIIEDHVWALMEALGVRDSLRINRRISEAIGTVLDRQRDALPEAGVSLTVEEAPNRIACTQCGSTTHELAITRFGLLCPECVQIGVTA